MSWNNIYISTADKPDAIDYILSRKKSEIENVFNTSKLFYSRCNQKNKYGALLSFETSSDDELDRKKIFYIEEITKISCVESTHTYTPMYSNYQLDSLGPKQIKPLHVVTQESNHVDSIFNNTDNVEDYYKIAMECSRIISIALNHELNKNLSRKSIMPSIVASAAAIFSKEPTTFGGTFVLDEFYTSIKLDVPKTIVVDLEGCFEEQCQELENNNVNILCPMDKFSVEEKETLDNIQDYLSNFFAIDGSSKMFAFLLHSIFNNFGFSIAEEVYLTYLVKSFMSTAETA